MSIDERARAKQAHHDENLIPHLLHSAAEASESRRDMHTLARKDLRAKIRPSQLGELEIKDAG